MNVRILLQVFCLSLLANLSVIAEQPLRILELSMREIPLSGKVRFLTDPQATEGVELAISNERYFWKSVPEGASHFVLESLTEKSDPTALYPAGSTFVTVNPAQALNPVSLGSGQVTRLPFMEPAQNMPLVETGQEGWVFVGGLQNDGDNSSWSSIYILNASDMRKPDHTSNFTFTKLRERIVLSDVMSKSFVADFPLVLRDSSTSTAGSPGFPVVRAGQKLLFLEVVRLNKSVKARVRVQ